MAFPTSPNYLQPIPYPTLDVPVPARCLPGFPLEGLAMARSAYPASPPRPLGRRRLIPPTNPRHRGSSLPTTIPLGPRLCSRDCGLAQCPNGAPLPIFPALTLRLVPPSSAAGTQPVVNGDLHWPALPASDPTAPARQLSLIFLAKVQERTTSTCGPWTIWAWPRRRSLQGLS